MDYAQRIDDYLAGPQKLRAAVAGMTAEQLDARPITLEKLLANITNHISHHVKFIEEKKAALARRAPARSGAAHCLFLTRLTGSDYEE